jgi:hypothetical protein
MPWIALLMLLMGPRVVIFLTWLLSGYFNRAYETNFWPFLGFLFLPYTTLCYAISVNSLGGLNGIGLGVLVLGTLLDLGVLGGGTSRRRRPPTAPGGGLGTFDADGLKRVN